MRLSRLNWWIYTVVRWAMFGVAVGATLVGLVKLALAVAEFCLTS